MNGKQIKKLRRLGLDSKQAKRAFNDLSHVDKNTVLSAVAHMKMVEQMEEILKKNIQDLEVESDGV